MICLSNLPEVISLSDLPEEYLNRQFRESYAIFEKSVMLKPRIKYRRG